VLLADEKELDPQDYDMIGVLGQVSSKVHAGGTGEMIFSQAGSAPRGRHPRQRRRFEAIARGHRSGGHAIRKRALRTCAVGKN
jgi:hypothetical protein